MTNNIDNQFIQPDMIFVKTFTHPNFKAKNLAIMQNMIFDSVFEVDSVLENKIDF